MERHANLGYIAFKRQDTDRLTVTDTPDVYLPIYSADIKTNPNFQRQNPIVGNKFASRSTLRGLRDHTGTLLLEGEPTTATYLHDMFLTRDTETDNAGIITTPFELDATTDPEFYTADISYVTHVVRYIGLAASQIVPEFDGNEMRFNCNVSCLKAWDGREVASIDGQTITFKQNYDREPTNGLVAGDTLQVWDTTASVYIDVVVASVDSTTVITVTGTITAVAAGDFVTIKPASAPTFSNLPTFTWGNTEFRFGATAAAALTATHTPLESDSSITLLHPFEEDTGAKRSGSFDPASLVRMQGDYNFTTRKYFDTPEDLLAYSAMDKKACVMRSFSYDDSGNTYEYRITLNNMTQGNPIPNLNSGDVLYSEIEFSGNYDDDDAKGMSVTVISDTSLTPASS